VFTGQYFNSVGLKNRIIVPSKFREKLGGRFMLTKALDPCLYIYPMDEWQKFQDKLAALPMANKEARAFVRYFAANAVECETDRQGRMIVPQDLKEYAKIDKDLITKGMLTKIEIWSRPVWEIYDEETNLSPDEIAGKMIEFGI
jgi:MraZ protein